MKIAEKIVETMPQTVQALAPNFWYWFSIATVTIVIALAVLYAIKMFLAKRGDEPQTVTHEAIIAAMQEQNKTLFRSIENLREDLHALDTGLKQYCKDLIQIATKK